MVLAQIDSAVITGWTDLKQTLSLKRQAILNNKITIEMQPEKSDTYRACWLIQLSDCYFLCSTICSHFWITSSSTKFPSRWISFCPYFRDQKMNASIRNPFEESDETRDHVEYKATAYQRSKTSDNNPITYPPVILSCLNSTIMGELCACAADRHKITSRGVCFLPSQCAPCLPLREKGLMLAWYCIRHPQ